MHLLVAEDNTLNYEVISELLAMYGITCDHAEDGSVCVEMFRESSIHTYDAILMDMQMPVMDGLQATSAIRNLNKPGAHSIPIIAMTANAFKYFFKYPLGIEINLKGIFLLSDIQGRMYYSLS